jgi:hypothetical protein
MKDREQNQFERVQLPPTWCSGICRNAMNEICIEDCAVKRDCSAFEEKPNLNLSNMPRFPETKGMTKEEKFTSVTIYLSKVVDHLQGVDYEPFPYRRPYHDRTASSQVSANIEIKSVLHGFSEAVTPLPDTEKREDQNVRPEEVVGSDD